MGKHICVEARILEGAGCEKKSVKLDMPKACGNINYSVSDTSVVEVSLNGNTLNLLPIKEGKCTVLVNGLGFEEKVDVIINKYIESGRYKYKNVPIPGGGFVTGFIFHPVEANVLYCRTDIGGVYRYDFESDTWISLIDHATDPDKWETFPLSVALDKQNPSYVYTLEGDNIVSKIAFSDDYGAHWTYFDTPKGEDGNPVKVNGNGPGRSTGERLAVDPNNSNILYLGTMADGLWRTTDRCKTWEKVKVAFEGKACERNIAFVEFDPCSETLNSATKRIVVATSGEMGSPDGVTRGASVYISNDAGKNFEVLKGAPKPALGGPNHPGYVGQRAAFIGKYLFITYSAYNVGWDNWNSYGCDSGLCYDGAVYRFEFDDKGNVIQALDITPIDPNFKDAEDPIRRLGFGMSGLSVDAQQPGTLICSSITSESDTIYRSKDYGLTWKPIMSGLSIGKINFNVSYMHPKYSGNISCVHWMSDLKINPFNSDMAFFNTGIGIFMTKNLTDEDVVWQVGSDGVEETVHLNLYSPPAGDVKLIDILGDYGGFVFRDLDKPAENTFADYKNDRWVTAMNADYPDSNPQIIIATPRGNWKGKTKGGLIITHDQGKTWSQFKDPVGLTEELDNAISVLKKPNNTSGWAAISSDAKAVVWAVSDIISTSRLVHTFDMGETWKRSVVYDILGNVVDDKDIPIKVMSDRVNPHIFYGFGSEHNGSVLYVSCDKGSTFKQISPPKGFPSVTLSGIDSKMPYEIRVEPGKEGVIWIAMQEYGLWKLCYHKDTNSFSAIRVSKEGDNLNRIGFGKPEEGSSIKMFYSSGTVNGEYGFWRSNDEGRTWKRINDDAHQYGDIRSITGDPRVFGRIYVGTGTRGIVYGDIEWQIGPNSFR